MTITLQVAQAFDTYHIGDQLSLPDAAALALLKAFPGRYQFSSSAPNPSPGSPIIVPAQPSALVLVVGVPDPSLGAVYGYALDLTSIPNVLYHWLGTAWALILTDHPSGIAGLSGQVPSSANLQGILASGIAAAGTAPASANASAGAGVTDLLAGSGPASAGAAATPSANDNVNGVAANSASVTGTASAADTLTGAVPASAAAAGPVSINGSSSGAVPSSAGSQAALTAVDSIGGAVPSSAAASGILSGTKTRSYARTFAFGLMGVPRAA